MDRNTIDNKVIKMSSGHSNPRILFDDFLKGKTEPTIHSDLVEILVDVASNNHVDLSITSGGSYNKRNFRPIYSSSTVPENFVSELLRRTKKYQIGQVNSNLNLEIDSLSQLALYDSFKDYNINIIFD